MNKEDNYKKKKKKKGKKKFFEIFVPVNQGQGYHNLHALTNPWKPYLAISAISKHTRCLLLQIFNLDQNY